MKMLFNTHTTIASPAGAQTVPPARLFSQGIGNGPAADRIGRRPARLHVLLAEDHGLIRSGVRRALRYDAEIDIVAETGTAAEVLTLARRTRPDTVLLGLEMHGQTTLAYLERFRAGSDEAPVIVVADPTRLERSEDPLRHGAASVILTTIELDELAPAIKAVVGGVRNEVFGVRGADESVGGTVLTPREIDALKALGSGLTNRAIARELSVTEHTVKFHLTSVYRKLGLRSRAEAAHWSVENGLVSRAFAAGLRDG